MLMWHKHVTGNTACVNTTTDVTVTAVATVTSTTTTIFTSMYLQNVQIHGARILQDTHETHH